MYLEGSPIELYAIDAARGKVGLGQAVFVPFQKNDGGYVDADAGGYQILLNFRGPLENFESISLTDVLTNSIPQDLMRDRIVLIGAKASSLNDLFYTPYNSRTRFDRTPGVVIHANIISQILLAATAGRPRIQFWPEPIEWLWIFVWSSLGAILAWKLLAIQWIVSICLVLGASLVLSAYLLFLQGWWIPVVPPLLALAGGVVAIGGYIINRVRRERQMLMNIFGRDVSPKIANAILRKRHKFLEEGRLAGHRLTATVLFTGLKGFSAIAEWMEPAELMSWLNEYTNTMAELVFQYDGVVDKFIGDRVMASFGIPISRTTRSQIAKDAISAVSCALQMALKLRQLNQQWLVSGLPTVTMQIGIATGTVVAGSLGSRQRLNYTTLGDPVNIASVLEGYDKSKHDDFCLILISPETHFYIQNYFPTQVIGTISFKGRSQPLKVHQVLLDDC
ncbi:MAG: adenylate/guanylate cyclase domain-containing protein [Hormoscilla sp. GM7CHS1pb]|nr:adenylate/guanylate cyclase domain-containing protein [Hormoscilla sp. GM7CHS1pb]